MATFYSIIWSHWKHLSVQLHLPTLVKVRWNNNNNLGKIFLFWSYLTIWNWVSVTRDFNLGPLSFWSRILTSPLHFCHYNMCIYHKILNINQSSYLHSYLILKSQCESTGPSITERSRGQHWHTLIPNSTATICAFIT